MFTLAKKDRVALFLGSIFLLGIAAASAPAQFRIPANWYDPFGMSRRAAFNIALYGRAMSQVPPYALGYNPYAAPYFPPFTPGPYLGGGGALVNNPYGASPGYGGSYGGGYGYMDNYGYGNPYGYGYYYDPYSGFLRGAADVINADGRFRLLNEQAKQVREQTRQASLENRRRAFDEWLYERANIPSPQEERERLAKLELRYHLTNPAATEILSADSLNVLLEQLRQMQAKGLRGPTIKLDKELLDQINVNPGTAGNIALVKNDGRLVWPVALSGPDFETERKNLDMNVPLAVNEVEKHGQIDRGRAKDLQADLDKMFERLSNQINDMTSSQFIEAKRYLNLLADALRALQSPDAAKFFTDKYKARGDSVGELVKNMAGLRFAPAGPGEEQAYRRLYQALVDYYTGAQQSNREPGLVDKNP